jgi:hypothetical protein
MKGKFVTNVSFATVRLINVFEILYVGPRRSCCILALVLRVMSKLFLLLFLNLPLGFQINHKKYEMILSKHFT